jgi:hypothetical protein
MEGAIDIRLIVTLGGILFSVAGAAAVGKMQIKVIQDTLNDIEARLRKIDQRIDTLENGEGVVKQRLADIAYLKAESDRMHKIHNGVHPPVANTRTAQ